MCIYPVITNQYGGCMHLHITSPDGALEDCGHRYCLTSSAHYVGPFHRCEQTCAYHVKYQARVINIFKSSTYGEGCLSSRNIPIASWLIPAEDMAPCTQPAKKEGYTVCGEFGDLEARLVHKISKARKADLKEERRLRCKNFMIANGGGFRCLPSTLA